METGPGQEAVDEAVQQREEWIQKVESIPEKPTRPSINEDEWLITRERLKDAPKFVEWSFGGTEPLSRIDMVEHMKDGTGAADMYVEITMNAIRSFKDLDSLTKGDSKSE